MDLKVCEDLTTCLTFHLDRDWEWIWMSVRISLHAWHFIRTGIGNGSEGLWGSHYIHDSSSRQGLGMDLKVCEDLTTCLTFHLDRDWEWIWMSVRISLHAWHFIRTGIGNGSEGLWGSHYIHDSSSRQGLGMDLIVYKDLTTYLTVHLDRDWEWIWRSVRSHYTPDSSSGQALGMDLKVCKDLTTCLTFHLDRDWKLIWRSVRISLHTWQFI